jgi:adenylosuccinate synthase
VPLLRYTAMVNGFDSLIVTKLDVLDEFEKIKVCVAYRVHGEITTGMPAENALLEKIEPVYEEIPGWKTPTSGITRYEDLPGAARNYIAFLEEKTGVEVGCVSTGPDRSQTMIRAGSKMEKLLA